MDFIQMIESPYNEFELTKPDCIKDSFEWNKWKGVKVKKYIGAIIVTNSMGVTLFEDGDFLPVVPMVTQSEWTTILEKSEDNA